ncbi:MAG: hypothetical protein N4J56_006629 [Chroococcidiopsis sp. SAG 2025]|uniref:SDR family NAD(P)-dependent oxidoreductase n=1 Tax=Chroococcidiopsis sp. SAG 2025 TaxID=171389 RepID=UPI00293725EB|nr:SDR family NAD(P)-dependent oxidoreductase [Chroococcidiopsis sp. SAG 2025]MDV2996924.1 hypothetical protein [Chroococcidiopsis sp. SAG 2025]
MSELSRRQIIAVGAIGAARAATTIASQAQANTQKPVAARMTMNPKGKFANKTVLITGATSGIGEGTAYAFAREGAKVMFCGRRANLGKQVESRIRNFGGEAIYQQADVRLETEVKSLTLSYHSR